MAKTIGMRDADSPDDNAPKTDLSRADSSSRATSYTPQFGTSARATDITNTGIQTSGAGEVPRGSFAEVPVAPCAFGDYELLEEIARGGMGVVYRARQVKLNRIVALKMILPGMLSSPTAIERFYEEARAAANLDHPNIVPIYDIGEFDGQHFFTMAFIEGRSLRDLVRKETLSFGEAVRLLKGIAEGVGFAHDHQIIHRDLKPDNVLIDKQGRPRVTDFGLAKRTDAATGLTVTGQILGTPTYMSPEQALGGNRTISTPTDIYAIGGILYYALTGQPPFQGDTMTEVLCQVIATPPISPTIFNATIPEDLEAIVMKCLEKEPEKRYASCWEFRDALASWEQQMGSSGGSGSPSTVRTPATKKQPDATTEDSLFAGLPKSFPPSTQKNAPQRKPWDYSDPTPYDQTPLPLEKASLELSGSRPIVLPSSKHAAVDPGQGKKNYPAIIAVMAAIFLVTVVVVSQWPNWFASANQDDQGASANRNGSPPRVRGIPEQGPGEGDAADAPGFKPHLAGGPKAPARIPPGGINLDEIPELKVKRKEFKVQVEMIGGRLDPDGIRRFQVNDLVQYDVTPEIDCYIGIWSVNGDGTVDQVFPHPREPEHLCLAGKTRRLPGKIKIEMIKSVGIDQAWILASDKPWNPDQAEKDADLNFFLREREWKNWIPKQRAMQVRPDLKLSETVIRFQVLPQ